MFIEGYGNVYVGVGFAQEPAGTWSWDSIPAHMTFKTCDVGQSEPVERMRLTNTGNLGIGTTDPTSTLHIAGNTQSHAFVPTGLTIPKHGIYSPSGNNIAFSTNLSSRLIISDAGQIGIGTAIPIATLDVYGDTQVNGNLSVNGNTSFTGNVSLPPSTKFNGATTFPSTVTANAFIPTGTTIPVTGMYSPLGTNVGIAVASQQVALIDSSGLNVQGIVQTKGYTVATLPVAGTAGRRAYVTDALNPVFLQPVVGAGAVVCPVFDNGIRWIVA